MKWLLRGTLFAWVMMVGATAVGGVSGSIAGYREIYGTFSRDLLFTDLRWLAILGERLGRLAIGLGVLTVLVWIPALVIYAIRKATRKRDAD